MATELHSKLSIASREGILQALVKYKLYAIGLLLILGGIILSIASFLPSVNNIAEVFRLPGLHLVSAGLVLILVEYFVRGDTANIMREQIDSALVRYPLKTFAVITFFGALVRAVALGVLGWYVGVAYTTHAEIISKIEHYIFIALVVSVAFFIGWLYVFKKRRWRALT